MTTSDIDDTDYKRIHTYSTDCCTHSTGDYTTGDYTTGDQSTGDQSTGDQSTGDQSTGDYTTQTQNLLVPGETPETPHHHRMEKNQSLIDKSIEPLICQLRFNYDPCTFKSRKRLIRLSGVLLKRTYGFRQGALAQRGGKSDAVSVKECPVKGESRYVCLAFTFGRDTSVL